MQMSSSLPYGLRVRSKEFLAGIGFVLPFDLQTGHLYRKAWHSRRTLLSCLGSHLGGNPMTCMAVTSCHPSPDPKNTKHSPAWVQLLRCCIPARVDQEPEKLMVLPWAELSGARPLLPSQPLLGQRSIVAFVEHILLAIRKAVKRSNTWPSSDTLKCDACNVK